MGIHYTKPFLKWPGGKLRLLDRILPALPAGSRLVEPFVGAGAVFLNAPHERFLVCDANRDLIALFTTLKARGDAFINRCAELFTPANNTSERYYALRERFNASKRREERSALFVYLNRHAYNGLVRYNAHGGFNVPFGRYKLPRFPELAMRSFAAHCCERDVHFAARDFRRTFAALKAGDVIYCDPPYMPLSATASFTTYAGHSFGIDDHRKLARLALRSAAQGLPVIISNHDLPCLRSLYASARLEHFFVRRFISCNAQQRAKAPELLAVFDATNTTSLPPQPLA